MAYNKSYQPRSNSSSPDTMQTSMAPTTPELGSSAGSTDYLTDYEGVAGGNEDSGTYAQVEDELLRLQIDVKDLLDDFEHRILRGEKRVLLNSGALVWEPYEKAGVMLLNEHGIRQIMARLIGKVTKAAKLSYKTEEEIYKDMFYFHLSMTELLAKKCDEYNLDPEFAKAILDASIELVWDIAASSRNGFTAINLRSQYSRSDVTRMDTSQKENKSFLGIPLGRR